MDWNRGYVVDSGYVYEYFHETNPAELQFLAKLKNHYLPDDNFRYLELGCGQGFNLICIAALHPQSEFIGVDFYPEHICHARRLAQKANIQNVSFYEADFVELADNPESLGSFHLVVAHGITTWVSSYTRGKVFELSSKVLKPGGIMYNSYNSLPGWLSGTPFQHLVIEYQKHNSGIDALKKAKDILGRLREEESTIFKALPELGPRLDKLENKPIDYLLQEYNHPVWQPIYSSEMLRIASNYKLNFLGSSELPLAFSETYTTHQNEIFQSNDDVMLRECIKDIYCNTSFRRDVYIKGSNPLWKNEARESVMDQYIVSTLVDICDAPGLNSNEYKYRLTNGNTITIPQDELKSILSKCQSGRVQIRDVITQTKISFRRAIFIISILLDNKFLALVPADLDAKNCIALNKVILNSTSNGAPYRHLITPNFFRADRLLLIELIITDIYNQGARGNTLRKSVVSKCDSLSLVTKDGKALAGRPLRNCVESYISDFENKRLPFLLKSGAMTA